jgi:hypothetical protein
VDLTSGGSVVSEARGADATAGALAVLGFALLEDRFAFEALDAVALTALAMALLFLTLAFFFGALFAFVLFAVEVPALGRADATTTGLPFEATFCFDAAGAVGPAVALAVFALDPAADAGAFGDFDRLAVATADFGLGS